VVQASPGSDAAARFVEIAERLVERVESQAREPELVVDRGGGKNRRLPVTR
jgi:hypothetical protein